MRVPRLLRFGLAAILLAIFGVSAASAECRPQYRQSFFRSSSEGDFAYISDAIEGPQARTLYSKWCRIEAGDTIKANGPSLYFGVNNRSMAAGRPGYLVVKIFRYSPDTRSNPLISYWRRGEWTNSVCKGAGASGSFEFVGKGLAAIEEFYRLLQNPAPANPSACRPFQRWLGSAFDRPDFSLYGDLPFLRSVPRRVRETGPRKWSMNLVASTYRTALRGGPKTAEFPLFEFQTHHEEEIFVQVMIGGRTTTFRVQP